MFRISRKVTAGCMLAVALSGVLTGCGGSEKSGVTELEVFSSKAENKAILQTLADKFCAGREDVKIVINAPADPGTVLKTRLAKNDLPDIVAMGGDNNYTEIQSAGVLEDLGNEPYMANVQEAYLQMVYDVNDGKEAIATGVPYATNAAGVLYNVDKFEELGLEIPKTWDEFMAVIEQIEAAGEKPFLLTYKDAWTANCAWNSMAADLQPETFSDDKNAKKATYVGTHEETAEKYLTILSHAQEDFMGTGYDDGNKAFANGEAVMMINGNWTINQFRAANPDFNVDMFALPASNDASKNYVTSGVDVLFGICSDSENLEAAKEFVAFMMEPENAQTYIDDQFVFSAVKGIEQDDVSVAGVKEDIANGKVANFPDHYYPSGFDFSVLLTEFSLNYVNGKENGQNIADFLAETDEKYDTANVE